MFPGNASIRLRASGHHPFSRGAIWIEELLFVETWTTCCAVAEHDAQLRTSVANDAVGGGRAVQDEEDSDGLEEEVAGT